MRGMPRNPQVPHTGPSKRSDVYSFGALLYHMATCQQPHRGVPYGRLLLGLATGALRLDEWPREVGGTGGAATTSGNSGSCCGGGPTSIYKPLRKLGEACCAHDPSARPSFQKCVAALIRILKHVTAQPAPPRAKLGTVGSGQAQAERPAVEGAGLGEGAGAAGRAPAGDGVPSGRGPALEECESPIMPPGIAASLCIGMVVPFRTVSQRGLSGNAREG